MVGAVKVKCARPQSEGWSLRIWQGSQVVRRQPAKLRIVSSTLTLASICPLSLAGQSVRLRTARPGVQISQGIPAD